MSSLTKRHAGRRACMATLLAASGACAHDTIVLSEVFQVCARNTSGLTVDSKQGIDAVEGRIAGGGEVVDFMISTNPNLPAGMHIEKSKGGWVLPPLSDEIVFIAESTGALGIGATGQSIGYGTEHLYAFVKEIKETPLGPRPRRIFVQIWSGNRRQNIDLLRKAGGALYRCR